MSASPPDALLATLADRFDRHRPRHPGLDWPAVEARLRATPPVLHVLAAMEASGGEPDVVGMAAPDGRLVFVDCAPESPAGRRSLCYDGAALAARKENKPRGNALDEAAALGVALLDEDQYRHLQTLGEFDRKTSSWILTPPSVRDLGGALFCDRRYGQVFTYHNGADSYYAARGFRGWIGV